MKYRNTITGAIVDVKSKIHGNWEPLETEVPVISVDEKVEPKKTRRKKVSHE